MKVSFERVCYLIVYFSNALSNIIYFLLSISYFMEKINELYYNAYNYLEEGKTKEAISILNELKKMERNINLDQCIGGLLIDIGYEIDNIDFIEEGITIFTNILKVNNNSVMKYNLANGYFSKYKLKKSLFLNLEDKTLYDAKKLYKESLKEEKLIKAMINLANIYDVSGRFIESLYYYNQILELEPNNVYVLINKGITLCNYDRLMNNPSFILFDAYNCFEKSLKQSKITLKQKQSAEKGIKYVENYIDLDKEYIHSPLILNQKNDFESFLDNFCLRHKLYLNLCTFCQKCSNARGDTIAIKNMIDVISENFEESIVLKLNSYLNQIKMDFISTRFLIALSECYDIDFDFIDKNAHLVETYQYEDNGIRTQLLKNAFNNLFNILDKISYFMNDYLELGIKYSNVSFRKIWFNKGNINKGINEKLRVLDNKGITALFDIYRDFEKDGEYNYLKYMRNLLTHRYLKITHFKVNQKNKSYDEFLKDTLKLAGIVRNSIIYLINLVNINENLKSKQYGNDLPKINIYQN